ncbi:MAG: hypothetical protein ABSG15_08045 [FCB group bacterium]|jgi:hypothetical protein
MKFTKLNTILIILTIIGTLILSSCANDNSVSAPVVPPSNPINSDTITGLIKGTLLAGKTYYMKDSIIVKAGDTLLFQAGAKLLVINGSGVMYIRGNLISNGTQSSQVYIQPIPARQTNGIGNPSGWGGIVFDSGMVVKLYWTHVEGTGGNDYTGHAIRSLQVTSNATNTTTNDIEDCWFINTTDDGFEQSGGTCKILRNTFWQVGQPDGDAVNLKSGVQGEIAYNVVWNDGGNCIKITSGKTTRATDVSVHNNTFVASGRRRVTELGYGVLLDNSARAEIYNNIIGDNYQQIELTSGCDTSKTLYGNNLFFGSADSLKTLSNIYPSDGWGKVQASDVLDRSSNPPKAYDASTLFTSYTFNWTSTTDNNNYHLKSGSPALGKGLMALPAGWTWNNPVVSFNGDPDIGAFTTSANSHK